MAFDFITTEYFQGNLNLSGLEAGSNEGDIITQKIEFYKYKYFDTLLGQELSRMFIAEINTYDPLDPFTTEQRWLNLAFGSTYVGDDNMVYKWRGFRSHDSYNVDEADEFISPFANFIFVKHLQQISNVTTSMGVKAANVENMAAISPTNKLVEAWNDMCEWHWHLHNYIMSNLADYAVGRYIGEKYTPSTTKRYDITENQNLFIPINYFGI
jgi:hypothetical protein